uniref:Uncharacterized protein n=1 Tax=Timema poppense TaxID=170557 RepID=A0A7R9DEC8_TIMPO|nr:unnamed protein product [Timema poppensis]
MDAVYPEPMSRLHRRTVRKPVHRGPAGRYRTQPVTFSEIKIVEYGLFKSLSPHSSTLAVLTWQYRSEASLKIRRHQTRVEEQFYELALSG